MLRATPPDLAAPNAVAPQQPPLAEQSEPSKSTVTAPAPAVTPVDGYYPFEEVDEPATPLGEWLIDANMLPRGTMVRIELWLWISASGKIDQWELGPDTPNDGLIERALAELDQTPTQPARRNNMAVPSFRRLEVFISRD